MRFPPPSLLAGHPKDRIASTRLNDQVSRLALAVVAATLAATLPCPAQARVEVTPFVGAYLPGNDFGSNVVGDCGIDDCSISGTSWGQQGALIGGAQFTAWLGSQVGVELAAGYARSGTIDRRWACSEVLGSSHGDCPAASGEPGQVVTGSARVLLRFSAPRMRQPSLYVVAGGGVVNHSGTGVDHAEQTLGHAIQRTYWGPIVGIGVRLPLTPARAARVELVRAQPGTESNGDYLLSVGLSATLRSAR